MGHSAIGKSAREQGLQPPSETEQQWQVEPRGKGLDNRASEPQHLFPQCYTLVRLAV